MRTLPILFSDEMVRAILDGRKTQTRRIVKPQPPTVEAVREKSGSDYGWMSNGVGRNSFRPVGPVWAVRELMGAEPVLKCRYGGSGDRLYVREAWAFPTDFEHYNRLCPKVRAFYRATEESPHCIRRWRPSIHMPLNLSRITLENTEIRVERVQDISEADAKAEGCSGDCPVGHIPSYMAGPLSYHYAQLWDKINGDGSWASNPWVYAVTFKAFH
jgi:hypothetical protein